MTALWIILGIIGIVVVITIIFSNDSNTTSKSSAHKTNLDKQSSSSYPYPKQDLKKDRADDCH